MDRLVQDYSNSNASTLELLQSRTKPSICGVNRGKPGNESTARVLSVNRQKALLTRSPPVQPTTDEDGLVGKIGLESSDAIW